jgi:hypothetical protein
MSLYVIYFLRFFLYNPLLLGYMNLSEGVTTPMFAVSPSGSGLEHVTIASDKSKDVLNLTPRCWKTVYYLLDLYATMPETKTITHR